MTISVADFAAKYDGKAVDYDKQYGAQCDDLFNFYNSEVVGAPFIGTPNTGGARDLYESESPARAENYKKLDANSPVQAGDVQIYGAPQGRAIVNSKQIYYGHCNIVLANGKVIQQNAKWNQLTTIDDNFSTGLIGILRPLKFIGENSPQNVEPPTQNKNKHTISQGDTFWGLEESKGIPHGTLQQLNPGLDAHALPIGGTINLPDEPTPAPSPAEEFYTIKSGDTYWGLEDAFQLTHGTLQQLNPQYPARSLPIGARIRIK